MRIVDSKADSRNISLADNLPTRALSTGGGFTKEDHLPKFYLRSNKKALG